MKDKRPVPAFWFALIYLGLGDNDRTMEWLEKAYQERFYFLAALNTFPDFGPLRNDRRFRNLTGRIGFGENR